MKYVGLVDYTESGSVGGIDYDNGVANDIQLILASNATINCNKDKFVAIDMFDGRDYKIASGQEPGFLPVWWANRMWYGCRKYSTKGTPHSIARVFFSDTLDYEALDLTADGDNILIPNDSGPIRPITGMLPTPSALAVFKEEETHAIFGTDETNFSRRKILDDGCLYRRRHSSTAGASCGRARRASTTGMAAKSRSTF